MGEEVGEGREGGGVCKQSLPLTSSLCHSQGVGSVKDDMEGFTCCLSPRSLEPYAGFWDSADAVLASLCGDFLVAEKSAGVV
jgi:hypothetical protein